MDFDRRPPSSSSASDRRLRRVREAKLGISVRMLVLVTAICLAGVSRDAGADSPEKGLRVLLIGNSLTYSNSLPKLLEGLLVTAGVEPVHVEAVAFANYGLQDHWSSGPARKKLARGGWDFVILQQGPSATEGRPSLLEYSRWFSREIATAGARPALYMVWPSKDRSFDFEGVADSYRTAARLNDAVLLPVGDAWRHAWRFDPDLQLYDRDGFHPSKLGSTLAALVMFEGLTGKDSCEVAGQSRAGARKPSWTPELVKLLCDAASAATGTARADRR